MYNGTSGRDVHPEISQEKPSMATILIERLRMQMRVRGMSTVDEIIILGLSCGILFLIVAGTSGAVIKQTGSAKSNVYVSRSNKFMVQYNGTLIQKSKNEYEIKLRADEELSNDRNEVHIFVSERPFVYLPGTFGGKYYFADNPNSVLAEDRIPGDSMTFNGIKFARDYWAVYAGQGQWEAVINCYGFHGGKYFVLSLGHAAFTGMPGEEINGIRVTKQQMRTKLINALRDTTNNIVRSFNQILGSFSVTK